VCSDDSLFLPGTLDKTFELVRTFDYKTVAVMKYTEGEDKVMPKWYHDSVPKGLRFRTSHDFMKSDVYYYIINHFLLANPRLKIPKRSPLLSCVVISRQLLMEVGGWDCAFQTQAVGNIDLSARLMKYGMKYVIQDLVCSRCGWMPAKAGDHGAVHRAQMEDDTPLINKMYAHHNKKVGIPLDNWKDTEEKWSNKIKLSIVVPAINTDRWMGFYESITKAYSGEWELILLGPYDMSEELKAKGNVRWIYDWGSPSRRCQRGLLASKGEFVMFSWDDAIFYPGMIDKTFELHDGDYKTVVSSKYLESDMEVSKQIMIDDAYYTVHYHQQISFDSIPKDFKLWQTGIATRKLLIELGGIDCSFEAVPMAAQCDIAIRMQFYGCKFIMQDGFILKCSWSPDREHHPPTRATVDHDIPLLKLMAHNKDVFVNRTKIRLDNWELSPEVWERRNQ